MVFNVTFNNISWWPVLLVDETGVPGENWQTLSQHDVSSKPFHALGSN